MAADINMYGLKYQFSRTSTNGADILITIHKKWYEGEVITRALGRAPVIKRENKDHIYGTSCELYLECKVDGEFAEMYTSDPMEYRVAVYKDEALLFIGFVSPELYTEPDIAPPYDVQIIATDGLGELKNFDFGKRGTASILSHINYLMSKSGIGVPINVVSDLRFADSSGVEVAAKEILSIKVNLDHEANNSCYEALQSLLASLNANITQLNGRYLIFRETDFIAMASDSGVEAFDVNGGSLVLPVAKFGSMQTCQWWPVGQLSTVIESAKNHISLKSSDHYKSNVLDFEDWSLIGASYDEKEAAYLLPNKNSAITQTITFGDQEVGYRLGLRVRARNVASGSSDKEQNLGLKVEMEGRAKAFSIDLGPNFWLIKSEGGNAGTPLGYIWRSSGESSIEEELRVPSTADSAADAQNIDIVLPFIEEGSNNYDTYTYAKTIKINIFNPLGEHGIYVYDVSLVKYEQIKGYQADVLINNSAREAGADVEFTLSSGIYAPAAADIFMTGLPLQPSGHDIITQWKTGDDQMREYLAAMSFDYSRAVALPKMKYTGVLNVPGSEPLLPTLFLRDGTFYFPKTYTYDLYADELNVELISISAADVSLSSVVISQTSEASATMGATTGSVGGGGIVSMPRDKEMSDTSDNAVENRVIKAYVDNLWHLDENGNLVTDKQVLIKNNLIVEQDTSSGGDGADTPSGGGGLDEQELQDYLSNNKYINASNLDTYGVATQSWVSGQGFAKASALSGYLPLSGGRIVGNSIDIGREDNFSGAFVKIITNASTSADYGTSIRHYDKSSGAYKYQGLLLTNEGIYYSNNGSNSHLIHSGNIGSQSVASAKSLVASNGTTYVSYNSTYGQVNVNGINIGYGGNTIERASSGKLYIQKNVTQDTILNQYGGYVGIGTDSPSYKLDVNGDISAMSALRIGGCGTSYCGLYPNNQITSSGDSSKLWLYNESGLVFYGTTLEIYPTTILYDKLGIGTTSPAYALDVVDTGRFKAGTASDNYTALRLTNAWYGGSGKKNTDIVMESAVGYRGGVIRCTIDAVYGQFDSLSFGAGDNGASSYIPYLTISSAGNVTIAKNLIVSGDTSSGSDIRFKDVIKNKTLKIEHIAKAPLFTFKWNDRDDDTIHLGSSAQYWENVTPWLVKGDDFKTLDYSTLGVAMGISLAKKAVNHEERIKVLEKEIKRLKEEMIHG